MNTAEKAQERNKALFTPKEVLVLKCLAELTAPQTGREMVEISEVSFASGIRDTEETLRALYTLEGKNLVEPDPPGDFTSNRWRITATGTRAASML